MEFVMRLQLAAVPTCALQVKICFAAALIKFDQVSIRLVETSLTENRFFVIALSVSRTRFDGHG